MATIEELQAQFDSLVYQFFHFDRAWIDGAFQEYTLYATGGSGNGTIPDRVKTAYAQALAAYNTWQNLLNQAQTIQNQIISLEKQIFAPSKLSIDFSSAITLDLTKYDLTKPVILKWVGTVQSGGGECPGVITSRFKGAIITNETGKELFRYDSFSGTVDISPYLRGSSKANISLTASSCSQTGYAPTTVSFVSNLQIDGPAVSDDPNWNNEQVKFAWNVQNEKWQLSGRDEQFAKSFSGEPVLGTYTLQMDGYGFMYLTKIFDLRMWTGLSDIIFDYGIGGQNYGITIFDADTNAQLDYYGLLDMTNQHKLTDVVKRPRRIKVVLTFQDDHASHLHTCTLTNPQMKFNGIFSQTDPVEMSISNNLVAKVTNDIGVDTTQIDGSVSVTLTRSGTFSVKILDVEQKFDFVENQAQVINISKNFNGIVTTIPISLLSDQFFKVEINRFVIELVPQINDIRPELKNIETILYLTLQGDQALGDVQTTFVVDNSESSKEFNFQGTINYFGATTQSFKVPPHSIATLGLEHKFIDSFIAVTSTRGSVRIADFNDDFVAGQIYVVAPPPALPNLVTKTGGGSAENSGTGISLTQNQKLAIVGGGIVATVSAVAYMALSHKPRKATKISA